MLVGLLFCAQAGFARVSYQEASTVDVSTNSVEAVVVQAVKALNASDKEAFFALCTEDCIEDMKVNNNYMITQIIKFISECDLDKEFRFGVERMSEDKKISYVAIKAHNKATGRTTNFNVAIEDVDGVYKFSKKL